MRRLFLLKKLASEYEKSKTATVLGLQSENNKIFKIVVIGDSVAFGRGVRENQTFSVILEKELNKIRPTEVYLLAQSGDDVLNNFAKYELAREFIHPDLYIMTMVENDLLFNEEGLYPNQNDLMPLVSKDCSKPVLKYNYVDPSETWSHVVQNGFWPSFTDEYSNVCYLGNIVRQISTDQTDVIWFNFQHFPAQEYPDETQVQKEYRELLQKYESVVQENGGNVIGADLTKLNLSPVSEKESHPSVKSHEIFSQILFEEIKKHNIWGDREELSTH